MFDSILGGAKDLLGGGGDGGGGGIFGTAMNLLGGGDSAGGDGGGGLFGTLGDFATSTLEDYGITNCWSPINDVLDGDLGTVFDQVPGLDTFKDLGGQVLDSLDPQGNVLGVMQDVIKPVQAAVTDLADGDAGDAMGGLTNVLGGLGIDAGDIANVTGLDLSGVSSASDLVGRFGSQAPPSSTASTRTRPRTCSASCSATTPPRPPARPCPPRPRAAESGMAAVSGAATEIKTAVVDTGDDLLGASGLTPQASQAAAQAVADTAGDDLTGAASAMAATSGVADAPATSSMAPDVAADAGTDAGMAAVGAPADAAAMDAGADLGLGTDATARPPPAPEPEPVVESSYEAPDEFDQAIQAADQIESSVDDLFEGA